MADQSGLVTLKEIVFSAIADMGENTTHNYDKYLKWAIEAYQELRFDIDGEIKTVKLEMNDLFIVDAPTDMIDWIKIGKQVGDKIKVYGVNDNITFYHNKDECGNQIPNDPAECANVIPTAWAGGYWFTNLINEYGEFKGGVFGYGGAHNNLGYYRYDVKNRQFQFDSRVIKGFVLLEYLSSGLCPDEQKVVSRYAERAVQNYIHWKKYMFDKNYGPGNGHTQAMKLEYTTEKAKANSRINGLSVRDILEATRKYYMMSPKA